MPTSEPEIFAVGIQGLAAANANLDENVTARRSAHFPGDSAAFYRLIDDGTPDFAVW